MTSKALTYTDHLWGGLSTVDQRSREGMRTLSTLVTFLKDKAALDLSYSRQLAKIAKPLRAVEEVEGGTFQVALTHLHSAIRVIANNHEIFAAKIVQNMAKPLEDLHEEQLEKRRSLARNGAALAQKHRAVESRLTKSRFEAQKQCRAHASAKRAYELAVESQQAKQSQQSQALEHGRRDPRQVAALARNVEAAKAKAAKAARKAIAADKEFMAHVKHARGFRDQHDDVMRKILYRFEQLDAERLAEIQSRLNRFVTVHQSMMQSVSTLLGATSEQLKRMDVFTDIQTFIGMHKTGAEAEPLPEYEQFEGHPLHEEPAPASSSSDEEGGFSTAAPSPSQKVKKPKVQEGQQPQQGQRMSQSEGRALAAEAAAAAAAVVVREPSRPSSDSDASTSSFVLVDTQDDDASPPSPPPRSPRTPMQVAATTLYTYMHRIMYVEAGDRLPPDADREAVLELFQTAHGREVFASILNQHRNTNTGLQLSERGYELLGELVLRFLDAAQEAMHVHPAQLVMIMSQTFFFLQGDGDDRSDRVYLQHRISRHPLWQQMRFWEEAFYETYTAELGKKVATIEKWHSDAEQEEARHRQMNILFGQLGALAHNMREFCMDPQVVRAFVERMCEINAMPEDLSQALLEMHDTAVSSAP